MKKSGTTTTTVNSRGSNSGNKMNAQARATAGGKNDRTAATPIKNSVRGAVSRGIAKISETLTGTKSKPVNQKTTMNRRKAA